MSDLSIPTPIPLFEYGHDGLSDGQLIVEDLLCQVVDLRAADGDPEVIDDLLTQVELLRAGAPRDVSVAVSRAMDRSAR
jgi:hypothetical protein